MPACPEDCASSCVGPSPGCSAAWLMLGPGHPVCGRFPVWSLPCGWMPLPGPEIWEGLGEPQLRTISVSGGEA